MIEGYKKQTEAAAEAKVAKDSTIAERPGSTLTDIIKHPTESAIFGSLLKKNGADSDALIERLYKNELQQDDLSKLEEARRVHIQKMHEVENLEKQMTPEYITEFAKNSSKFQELVNLIGPKKSGEMLKNQMRDLLVNDSDKFDSLSGKLMELITYKEGTLSDLDKDILDECKKNGVSEANFMKALAMENEDEQREFLREHIRSSFGRFKRAFDFVGGWSKDDAKKLAARKHDMDTAVKNLNSRIGDVGSMLENVVDANDAVRNAFASEILGEQVPPPTPQMTLREARKETSSEEELLDQEWEKEKKALKFETLTPKKKEAAKNAFRTKMIEDQKKKTEKKGFWASLLSSLFETTVRSKDLK